jgi:hypothetical protein
MRFTLVIAAILLTAPCSRAEAQTPAAPYQRLRPGAEAWGARGGNPHAWSGGVGAYGGFVAPFFTPPIVAGSWYERPYPYHFDYYQRRWSDGDANGAMRGEMMPTADCPCLEWTPTSTTTRHVR